MVTGALGPLYFAIVMIEGSLADGTIDPGWSTTTISFDLSKKVRGEACISSSAMEVPHVMLRDYFSLAKKGPWAEHLTSLPKMRMGALSNVSTFNHKRALISCLQRLEANNWTQNNVQRITNSFEVEC